MTASHSSKRNKSIISAVYYTRHRQSDPRTAIGHLRKMTEENPSDMIERPAPLFLLAPCSLSKTIPSLENEFTEKKKEKYSSVYIFIVEYKKILQCLSDCFRKHGYK